MPQIVRADSLIPVVIVTARIAAENRIESFDVGADDYVPKPYTPDQIFEALEQAHGWKAQLDTQRIDGEVPLDSRDDGETLRCLARLRRMLQARSGLSCEEVDRISSAIKDVWSSADDWSRRRGLDRVASLAYSLTPESLTLMIRDEAGWLAELPDLESCITRNSLGDAQFDQVIADEARSDPHAGQAVRGPLRPGGPNRVRHAGPSETRGRPHEFKAWRRTRLESPGRPQRGRSHPLAGPACLGRRTGRGMVGRGFNRRRVRCIRIDSLGSARAFLGTSDS